MVTVEVTNITVVTGLWSWLCFCISFAMINFSRWCTFDQIWRLLAVQIEAYRKVSG
jgi:hypothetical protein